jgi:hypothetical protein
VLVALVLGTGESPAQRADGSFEPGKGRAGAREVPRPLDPGRIAILPFRTTGVRPELAHLGTGLAELLSSEFTGHVGPTAVEPGEAYLAWERARGDRTPLTRAGVLAVARSLGAGQVLVASIVGAGERFTVDARVLNVADGSPLGTPIRLQGREDSLLTLTSSLATQLLGSSQGLPQGTPNDAVRAYIDGVAALRMRLPQEAASHFLRAANLDSTFRQAAYRLVIHRAEFGPTLGVADFQASFRHLWSQRNRLSPEQRVFVEAVADSDGMIFRSQALPRMERAMQFLQYSAEAWNLIGDMYFHVGALIGREDWAERSRQAQLRARELDARICNICEFSHLADLAWLAGDARELARHANDGPWHRYLRAILLGDRAARSAARAAYAQQLIGITSMPPWLLGIPLPSAEVDSLLLQLDVLANTPALRSRQAFWSFLWSRYTGRPGRARSLDIMRPTDRDSGAVFGILVHLAEDDAVLVARPEIFREEPCELLLMRLRQDDTTGVSAYLAADGADDRSVEQVVTTLPRAFQAFRPLCGHVLRGVLASRQPSGGALLNRADSILRYMPKNFGDWWNYDIALAFARRGEYAAAAAAARRRPRWVGLWQPRRQVISLRQEGRWAALAGDTASAIKALREYLVYRDNPEPVLIPQRDSVRAELAALEQAQSRRRRP